MDHEDLLHSSIKADGGGTARNIIVGKNVTVGQSPQTGYGKKLPQEMQMKLSIPATKFLLE